MIITIQKLKRRTKLNFYQFISNYYDGMNYKRQSNAFQIEESLFSKTAGGISKIYNEVLLLMKLLQPKRQVKSMQILY